MPAPPRLLARGRTGASSPVSQLGHLPDGHTPQNIRERWGPSPGRHRHRLPPWPGVMHGPGTPLAARRTATPSLSSGSTGQPAPKQLTLFVPHGTLELPVVASLLESQLRSVAPRRLSWMTLLARVFRIEISVCSRCSGPMRVTRAVTTPEQIAAELRGARPPPRPEPRPSRGSTGRSHRRCRCGLGHRTRHGTRGAGPHCCRPCPRPSL